MNDIASQPVMSMYSTDPATGLTIISPRVYRLRQFQACEGINISDLRLEQRGLAPITYMHHVSKIIEGNTESYRVRICRTCSGLPTLLELGSYTDVESALLVNDVHELMQDRTKQLHLLCVDDVKYFNSIAVRRRGSPHDLLITSVLQERLWKKLSAASASAKKLLKEAAPIETEIVTDMRVNSFKVEGGSTSQDFFDVLSAPFASKPGSSIDTVATDQTVQPGVDRPQSSTNHDAYIPSIESTNVTFTALKQRNFSQPLQPPMRDLSKQSVLDKVPAPASASGYRPPAVVTAVYQPPQGDDFELPKLPPLSLHPGPPVLKLSTQVLTSSGCGVEASYANLGSLQGWAQNKVDSIPVIGDNSRGYTLSEDEDIDSILSHGEAKVYTPISFASDLNLDGKGVTLSGVGVGGEQARMGGIDRPSSQALSRARRIVDQFRSNLVRYHTIYLQWGFFECSGDIDSLFLSLTDFVAAELVHVIALTNLKRTGVRTGGPADSAAAVAAAEISLRESWRIGTAPRSTLLSTISSVFPGNSLELQVICKRVAAVIPQDAPSVSRFNDLYATAVEEVQRAETQIRALDSAVISSVPSSKSKMKGGVGSKWGEDAPVVDDREAISVRDPSVSPNLLSSLCFKECGEFIRQSYNTASYFDYSLRLCAWDGDLSGVQEAEVKLHGIYAQLENRFIAVTQFLLIVTSANSMAIKYASDRKPISTSIAVCLNKDQNTEEEPEKDRDVADTKGGREVPSKGERSLQEGGDAVASQSTTDSMSDRCALANPFTAEIVYDATIQLCKDTSDEFAATTAIGDSCKATMVEVLTSLYNSGDKEVAFERESEDKKSRDEVKELKDGVPLNAAAESVAQTKISKEVVCSLSAEGYASVEIELGDLLKKTTMCVTYCILVLTSAANAAWRLCGDALSASSCIRACNNFLPILVENIFDPSILQEFIQRHLDLMTSIILLSGRRQMLGCGFGVLGPTNDGGKNFVFSRYRPAGLSVKRSKEDRQEDVSEEEVKSSFTSSNSAGQPHTELRLLAFSLGGEIVKQSRRCFASFPKQLTGPAAMVHFEAAFRAYVAIFLASLALEESDLLMKLGYTVQRLLSATSDVLSSLQERMTKQNCVSVSTHTMISLHSMVEACIFHSKRHASCAKTIFLIVRSCRLILWGCSPRFVLAKMLLEHIAAEEGRRLFIDDKEQAAHLTALKRAADQTSSNSSGNLVGNAGPVESLSYSSSVTSIFSPFEDMDGTGTGTGTDVEGAVRDATIELIDDNYDYYPFECQKASGKKHSRSEGRGSWENGLRSETSSVFGMKKKKISTICASSSNSSISSNNSGKGVTRPSNVKGLKVGTTVSDSSAHLSESISFQSKQHITGNNISFSSSTSSSSSSSNLNGLVAGGYGNDLQSQPQTQHYFTNLNDAVVGTGMGSSSREYGPSAGMSSVGVLNSNPASSYPMQSQHCQQPPSLSGMSFGYPSRSLYEQQIVMSLSGSNTNMIPMVPGNSHSWAPDSSGAGSSLPRLPRNNLNASYHSQGMFNTSSNITSNDFHDSNGSIISSNETITINNSMLRRGGEDVSPSLLRLDSGIGLSSMQDDQQQQQQLWQQQQHQQQHQQQEQQWLQQQRYLFQQHHNTQR